MKVEHRFDGENWCWVVVKNERVLAEFGTNAEAWRFIERQSGDLLSPAQDRSDYGWRKWANGE